MKRLRLVLCVSLALSGATLLGQAGTASAKVCSLEGSGSSCGTGHGSVYSGEVFGALTATKKFTISSNYIFLSCPESEFAGEVNGETGAGSMFCSTTATWSGEWRIKTPDSYFVT